MNRTRSFFRAAAALTIPMVTACVLPVLTGCAGSPKATVAQPMAIPSGNYVFESITGFMPTEPIADSSRANLIFDTTVTPVRVGGSTSVNLLSGSATFNPENGGLSLSPFITTRRAGPAPLMAQENAVNNVLTQAKGYTLSNDLLTLTDGTPNGKLAVLRRVGK